MGAITQLFDHRKSLKEALSKHDKYKFNIYSVSMGIAICNFIVFTFIHRYNNEMVEMMTDIIAIIFLSCSLIIVQFTSKKIFVYIANIVMLQSIVIVMFYTGQSDGATIHWMYSLPLFHFFLLGTKKSIIPIIFSWCAVIVTFSGIRIFSYTPYDYALGIKIRFSVGFFILNFTSFLLEAIGEIFNKSLKDEHEQLLIAHEEIHKLAVTDILTGCYNRLYFSTNFKSELAQAAANKYTISIILCDVDHFKLINDTYGHDMGDEVLKSMGSLLVQSMRNDTDFAVRYGGEEFLMVFPRMRLTEAVTTAEKMRQDIIKQNFHYHNEVINQITASFGVLEIVLINFDIDNVEHVMSYSIKQADSFLYEAKNNGRNRVVSGNITI